MNWLNPVLTSDLHKPLASAQPKVSATIPPLKRIFDIILSLTLLVPLSLVMAVCALVLLIRQGRPIFYVSERMRSPDQPFQLYKFRTMARVDRDSGATGAHKNWRITRLGRFLRRSRIDELPQLFNILKGDMSFVGPRPPLREFVERFPEEFACALQCRPGVTGLATLIYHRHEDFILSHCHSQQATERAYYSRILPAKLKIEKVYCLKRNMWLDLWIMWHTVRIVLRPSSDRRIPRKDRPDSLRP